MLSTNLLWAKLTKELVPVFPRAVVFEENYLFYGNETEPRVMEVFYTSTSFDLHIRWPFQRPMVTIHDVGMSRHKFTEWMRLLCKERMVSVLRVSDPDTYYKKYEEILRKANGTE